ncbi:MAG TPA: CHAT domain-containing protein [Candidatus Angelobacter sp.]
MLVRPWNRRWRYNKRRRCATQIAFVILPLLFWICGCEGNRRASLEKLYSEARLQFQQGLTQQPLEAAESGYSRSKRYPELNWKFRILTAEARIRADDYGQALDILRDEPPSGLSSVISWHRTLVQGYALCFLNRYDQAEEKFTESESTEAGSSAQAELAYFRGRCALNRHALKNAENYFREALQDAQSDPFLRTYILLILGWTTAHESRYEEAVDWYNQALATVRPLRSPLLEEQALGNLASTYTELGDFPEAQKNGEAAEKIASQLKIFADDQKWLMDLGVVHQRRGQFGAAEESYKRALAIATRLKDTAFASRCLNNLTELKLHEGQIELAESYYREGSGLGLSEDTRVLWQLDSAKISTAHADYARALSELKNILQQLETKAQQGEPVQYRLKWSAQSQLAHIYALQNDPTEAEKWFQRSIATVDEAAKRMKHQEFATSMRDNMPVYDEYVAFLVAQKRPVEALQIAQLGRARTLTQSAGNPERMENTKAWAARVQNMLRRTHSVLLSYFATEKDCYLWAVTANQLRQFTLGISGPDLDDLIDSYHEEIQEHLQLNASPAAKRLFQVLVQPATDLLPEGSHVILVADSKIYTLNFETLIAPNGTDHYWVEDVDIQNTNSVDLLVSQGHRHSPSRDMLLIGAPTQADPHFAELPHAPEEMESVRRHFPAGETTAFTGKNATPGSYLQSHPGSFKFIHLATHGTPNALEPLDSAIILSSDAGGKFKLLGRDIVKVPLNAELVTISACEGVGTNIQSLEGLLGLEWAFMRAGAHQVVAALWDVDDSITPGLMDDFYRELQKGRTAADALRHAKLTMLHAGGFHATPYYWAALQLYTRS